jgi:putative ABC transport system substrate-binding protein
VEVISVFRTKFAKAHTADLIPKRFGLSVELVPNTKAIALLVNAAVPQAESQVLEMQVPTRALGLRLYLAMASSEDELDIAFASVAQSGAGPIIIANDPFFITLREQIVALALKYSVLVTFAQRKSALAGGLMSYAASFTDPFHQVGVYVGRILKGANPADLPV